MVHFEETGREIIIVIVARYLQCFGISRTGKAQMLKGGISDPRNKALMKMFNLIGIGERAGSGVPDIYSVWEQQGWKQPEVIEEYSPDRTILKLSLLKKVAIKGGDKKKVTKKQNNSWNIFWNIWLPIKNIKQVK